MSFGAQSSQSQQRQEIWQDQAPYLRRNFGLGQQLAQQQMGPVQQTANELSQMLMPNISSALGTASAVAGATDPAGAFLQARLGQSNRYLGNVIDNLGEDINRQLQRQMGAMGGQASMMGAGQVGGARHAIERGIAQEAALRQFGQGAQDLRYADYGRQGAEAEALQRSQLAGAGAVGALTPTATNLGLMPFNAAWLPLQQQAAVLGRPTVLGFGDSAGSGFNFAV